MARYGSGSPPTVSRLKIQYDEEVVVGKKKLRIRCSVLIRVLFVIENYFLGNHLLPPNHPPGNIQG
jgi:hypothetical protein